MKSEWIETDDALIELCTHLRSQPWVAVDTEFHRESTYYAQLALVQIASLERIACIDPLAGISLRPLGEILNDHSVLKVFHASRQDLEIFLEGTGALPYPVFDTQIAASLLGLGDQLGYGALVELVTGKQLDKLHSRTDWMRRPLDLAVIEYAAADVVHLRDVYEYLETQLRSLGRREWLDEEQAHLLREETFRIPEEQAWTRVKGAQRLRGVECVVARNLAAWRERMARESDRPRRRVLSDDAIIDLARQQPTKVEAMARMRSLDEGTRTRHGRELEHCIREGTNSPSSSWPDPLDRGPGRPIDPALIDALSAVLQVSAKEANISTTVLASRSDLEQVARGIETVPLLTGWRERLAGHQIRRFFAGELALDVVDKQLRVREASSSPESKTRTI